MMFLDCPAWLDAEGAQRCALPAEVRCRYTMRSSDGPAEAAMIRCPSGHWFNGPIGSLTWDRTQEQQAGHAAAASSTACRFRDRPDDAGPRRLTANSPSATATAGNIPRDTCPDRGDGPAVRHLPGQPDREASRPNTAPAYYLGRPAWLWLSATRPRRRPAPLAAAQTQTGGGTQPAHPAGHTRPEPHWAIPEAANALR
jgi:hypothetical protein